MAYICPRYVRVPMTSGSIWWTDLKCLICWNSSYLHRYLHCGRGLFCPRYVRVPMTSGSIWWTDLKFSITPDRCQSVVGEFEMLTFLPFESYYSFFLKYFKSVLCTLNLLNLSSVIGRRPFPKRHIRWIMVLWQSFFILIVTPDFHRGDESYYITKPAS